MIVDTLNPQMLRIYHIFCLLAVRRIEVTIYRGKPLSMAAANLGSIVQSALPRMLGLWLLTARHQKSLGWSGLTRPHLRGVRQLLLHQNLCGSKDSSTDFQKGHHLRKSLVFY